MSSVSFGRKINTIMLSEEHYKYTLVSRNFSQMKKLMASVEELISLKLSFLLLISEASDIKMHQIFQRNVVKPIAFIPIAVVASVLDKTVFELRHFVRCMI
ncbi:hypothetical protein TNCT_319501 [Trichonephila clavata]|uniref:Uncharacterized protein n=1 Tax=Trichonephila clavata TaxID=2740835 RepID=A0A8X6L868_TRICU|nr:hypothetical protein TNCT_319501 [Trichonephila clavata]